MRATFSELGCDSSPPARRRNGSLDSLRIASFADERKTSALQPRSRCQAETPRTTKPPVRQPGEDHVHIREDRELLEEDLAYVVCLGLRPSSC